MPEFAAMHKIIAHNVDEEPDPSMTFNMPSFFEQHLPCWQRPESGRFNSGCFMASKVIRS
jgi:hypothetical protein